MDGKIPGWYGGKYRSNGILEGGSWPEKKGGELGII
jgi:hypothetical protein